MPAKGKARAHKNSKKRTNSQRSPDNVTESVGILLEKRSDVRDSPDTDTTFTNTSSYSTMANQAYGVQPMNMSNLGNMTQYQTPPGSFYSPPPQQPLAQAQYINASQPIMSSPPPSQVNEEFQRQVLDKLSSMNLRLSKLDDIEKQLTSSSSKITSIDTRVTSLESSFKDVSLKMTDVEASRSYDNQTCDELGPKQAQLEEDLRSERDCVKKYAAEVSAIKSLPDDLDDMRLRSMRNNLLFHGFEERTSAKERRPEDCTAFVLDFLENTLSIPDASSKIKIERAHRLSPRYDSRKTRPIVVMFNDYPDKQLVKQKS